MPNLSKTDDSSPQADRLARTVLRLTSAVTLCVIVFVLALVGSAATMDPATSVCGYYACDTNPDNWSEALAALSVAVALAGCAFIGLLISAGEALNALAQEAKASASNRIPSRY